jgi:phosphomannomutase
MRPEIFKKYDIRGVYPEDLSEDLAYKLGRAFAAMRLKEVKKDRIRLAVGRDMRDSSPSLQKELVRGLREGGADVVDIGLVSTPTFYFGVAYFKYDGGLMVSASHNPARYNGFKMVREAALPVSGDTGIQDLRDAVMKGEFSESPRMGELTENTKVLEKQIEVEFAHGDPDRIAPMRIVADSANGMGALYLDALFAALPQITLTRMYWELDGRFPNHEADPFKDENIADLKREVLKQKADLGIATDGDGDRIFFIDNRGELIEPAIVRGILAKVFLAEKPGAKIAYDIRPGRITRDMIEQYGGTPVVTRVGHSLIKEQALKEGAYFAGESSGHFFLNLDYGCFEMPVIMTLKLLQELSVADKPVAEYMAPLRKYAHSGEINSKVESVDAVLDRIAARYKDGKVSRLDGVTAEYEDWWFNVRGSNTEPLIRLNLEAKTQKRMEEKRDEVLAAIRE